MLCFFRTYYVYILTNPSKTVLYTGVTNNLVRRLEEHKANRGLPETFAGRTYCYKLVYYESYDKASQAILREKEIKDLSREKKKELVAEANPNWNTILIFR